MRSKGAAFVPNLCALCGSNIWQWMTDAVTVFSPLDNAYVVLVHNSSPSLHVSTESFYTEAIFSLSLFAGSVCAILLTVGPVK